MSDDGDRPLLYAFGRAVRFLSPEEAGRATADERIASVWPFVGEKVRAFAATLAPRELANFDEEDSMLECWIAIRERDHKYDPAIGPYAAFAGPIVRNCLYRVREESRTVISAKNAPYRIRKAAQKARDGALTRKCDDTFRAIVLSTSTPATIDGNPDKIDCEALTSRGDQGSVEDAEELELSVDALIDGLLCLPAYEAMIVGQSAGLWGHPPRPIADIAADGGRTEAAVRAVRRKALAEIRVYLEGRGHPVSKPGWPGGGSTAT